MEPGRSVRAAGDAAALYDQMNQSGDVPEATVAE